MCDNRGCNNHALFKCARCTIAAYCSARCNRDHYLEHRMICKREFAASAYIDVPDTPSMCPCV